VLEQGRVTPDCKILDVEALISDLFDPKRDRERYNTYRGWTETKKVPVSEI
jgi:hypothetical protein